MRRDRRDRRDNMRRERIIMVVSSAFVLTALTMTGLYMKGQEMRQLEDGYTLDFAALENHTGTKLDTIGSQQAKTKDHVKAAVEPELDDIPMDDAGATQVDSTLIEIPGVTGPVREAPTRPQETHDGENAGTNDGGEVTPGGVPNDGGAGGAGNAGGNSGAAAQKAVELHYSEAQGLTKPVNGDVLMPYKMDGSVYFATLDQYKYNPATLFSAEVGSEVYACAEGKITEVFETAELGKGITMELGDGYTVTYGQLDDIAVVEGEYVQAGEKIGTVAAPSRYYVQEGTNLYFCMEKDKHPVNSEQLF